MTKFESLMQKTPDYQARLIHDLEHPKEQERSRALKLLSCLSANNDSYLEKLRDPHTIGVLAAYLQNESLSNRLSAARILKRLNHERAIAAVEAYSDRIKQDEKWDTIIERVSLGVLLVIIALPVLPILFIFFPQRIGDISQGPKRAKLYFELMRNGLGIFIIVVGLFLSAGAVFHRAYGLLILSILLIIEIVCGLLLLDSATGRQFISSL